METQYLSRDPDIMSGALCFKGTRVPVQTLFDYLEGSSSLEEFLNVAALPIAVVVLMTHSNELRLFSPLCHTWRRRLRRYSQDHSFGAERDFGPARRWRHGISCSQDG